MISSMSTLSGHILEAALISIVRAGDDFFETKHSMLPKIAMSAFMPSVSIVGMILPTMAGSSASATMNSIGR